MKVVKESGKEHAWRLVVHVGLELPPGRSKFVEFPPGGRTSFSSQVTDSRPCRLIYSLQARIRGGGG